MKKFIVFTIMVLSSVSLFANTYTTPTLDGNISSPGDWDVNENFETEIFDDANYTLWITWDETNLYIGIDREEDDDNRFLGDNQGDLSFFVAIDVDQTAGSGATADGYSKVTFSELYLPEYFFAFAGGAGWAEWANWTGTEWNWNGWSGNWGFYGWNTPGQYDDELYISWADIGNPTGIALKAWITGEGTTPVLASWPSENPIGDGPDLTWAYQFYSPHMEPINGNLPLAGVYPNQTEHSLPVTLSTFSAHYVNNQTTLYWKTESETDNVGFYVYRNTEDNFSDANLVSGLIEGHGTTSIPHSYFYFDKFNEIDNPNPGDVYYYWLESMDFGGTTHHYTNVASLTIPETGEPGGNIPKPKVYSMTSSPNPVKTNTEIKFTISRTSIARIIIYNLLGQKITELPMILANADEEVTVNWDCKDKKGNIQPNGIYFYELRANDYIVDVQKLVIMR